MKIEKETILSLCLLSIQQKIKAFRLGMPKFEIEKIPFYGVNI